MESKIIMMSLAVVLAALCLGASAMSLPSDEVKHNQVSESGLDEKERATWLDTRDLGDLEDQFKELVYLAVKELQNEGRISPGVVSERKTQQKRGRFQGFCFRRTRSGRFLPYICWKGNDSRK
uniref:Whitinin n=1 Tax=Platynereis dumerilii TaxID=6359 RepID=V5TCC5_PLADU|nr:whitnin-1 neuropeptide precursor SPTR [Platynereis dumerilii]QBA88398.1 Whitinin precursor [Platynereis dumerilii]